jgi:hypothetical protein
VQEEVEGALVGYAAGRAWEFAVAVSMAGRGRSLGAGARPGARWRRAALSSDSRLASGLRDGQRVVVRWPWDDAHGETAGGPVVRRGAYRSGVEHKASRDGGRWEGARWHWEGARGARTPRRQRGAGALRLQRFSVPRFDPIFLKIFQLKCTK